MVWTAGPALGISLVLFFVLGRVADPDADISTDAAREALASAFNISALNLLPLALLVVLAVLKMPPFLSILGSALSAAVLAPFLQWDAVVAFVDDPSPAFLLASLVIASSNSGWSLCVRIGSGTAWVAPEI